MNKEQTLLWLDDIRDPLDPKRNWLMFSPIEEPYEVIWVKSYKEFVNYIETNGLPTAICFDHDLGLEHIEYYFKNGGHDSPPNPMNANFVEKTGYDCAKWLANYCTDNDKPLPLYNIQSANPIGAENIRGLLENYKRIINGQN